MNEAKKNAGGAGFARIEIMMGMKKLTPAVIVHGTTHWVGA